MHVRENRRVNQERKIKNGQSKDRDNDGHKTQDEDSIKTQGWTHELATSKQFLFLIRHPLFSSHRQVH